MAEMAATASTVVLRPTTRTAAITENHDRPSAVENQGYCLQCSSALIPQGCHCQSTESGQNKVVWPQRMMES